MKKGFFRFRKQSSGDGSGHSRRQLAAPAVLAAFLASAMIAGCGQKQEDDYIGLNAATEAAFRDAGVTAEDASVSTAGLDKRDGTFFYQVNFSAGGVEYQYAVDAVTGVVIEANASGEAVAGTTDESAEMADGTGADDGDTVTADGTGAADGNAVTADGTGASDESTEAADGMNTAGANTDDAPDFSYPAEMQTALDAALEHAGLTEEDVFFPEIKLDHEHGRAIYEVEFISADGTEYEYEIDAADSSILKFSHDSESSLKQTPGSSQAGIIPEEQAKKSVLDRVPGADETSLSIRLREDDGRQEYKGQLLYGKMLYEFKIDAYSGMFIEWEAEQLE